MKGSKKISDIYKDNFKDLEIVPPDDVWKNIAASLPGKKRKVRILPLWYKVAGIAAVLGILYGIFNEPSPTGSKSNSPAVSVPIQKNTKELAPTIIPHDKDGSIPSEPAKAVSANVGTQQEATKEEATIKIKDRTIVSILEGMDPNPKITSGTSSSFVVSNILEINSIPVKQENEKEKINELKDIYQNSAKNEYKEDIEEKSSLAKRFSITPTAAVIYFDNLGSGNSLDDQFANKEGKGEITMAYGINLAYRLSEKIKIRAGFSKIELSHSTQDMNLAAMASTEAVNVETKTLVSPATGKLQQQLSFLEIPMEIEYALIRNKIGLNLIGGISTLFLNGNMLSLNSPISTTNLGQAANLNNISFSANIGIGLDYEVFSQFRLKLEPIFKYQLNTFNNISGYNPYYFGIYSGISYKF